MNKTVLAACLNEWMRRYIQDPKAYQAEFEAVGEFVKSSAAGHEPDYGVSGAEYVHRIAADLGLEA